MRLLFLTAVGLMGAVAAVAASVPATPREIITIDGHDVTIALATTEQMGGLSMALSFTDLILSIVAAFNEEDFDYWGNVEDDVTALVGAYVNEYNMHQVEVFQDDLEGLLLRYLEAPVTSDNYPDKNEQAAALSMAIVSHRYLVMSGNWRFSLILHFEDIASMHIVVIKDAAETYSTDVAPSQWYQDLSLYLGQYLEYSTVVTQELYTFRMDMISCTEDLNACRDSGGPAEVAKTCYDTYTVTDEVTGDVSECKQLSGATDCDNHCQVYRDHRTLELDVFTEEKVAPVSSEWAALKEQVDEIIAGATAFIPR